MSFILDALKKSETDRQRQNGPALFEVKVAPSRHGLPLWAVGLGVLLAVNLIIVAWVLLRRPAQADANAAQGQPGGSMGQAFQAASERRVGQGPSSQEGSGASWQGGQSGGGAWQGGQPAQANGQGWQGGQPGQAWQGGQNAQGWQGGGPPGQQGGQGQGWQAGTPGQGGQSWQGTAPGQGGWQGGGQPGQGAQQPWGGQQPGQGGYPSQPGAMGPPGTVAGGPGALQGQQGQSPGGQPAGVSGDTANADDYAPAADPPAAAPLGNHVSRGTSSGVPLYQTAALQAKLPELRLDLHVYAALPQNRFVMINMHKLREGDSLPEGVRVESITPEGAVLSKDGTNFLLPRQ